MHVSLPLLLLSIATIDSNPETIAILLDNKVFDLILPFWSTITGTVKQRAFFRAGCQYLVAAILLGCKATVRLDDPSLVSLLDLFLNDNVLYTPTRLIHDYCLSREGGEEVYSQILELFFHAASRLHDKEGYLGPANWVKFLTILS